MTPDIPLKASSEKEEKIIKNFLKVLFLVFMFSIPLSVTAYAGELSAWIQKAKEAQAEMMNVKPENIPDHSLVCETEGKAEERLISAFSALSDGRMHEVWVIGKGIIPVGTCLKAAFGESVIYSNDEMDVFVKGGTEYRVHRFVMQKRDNGKEDGSSEETHKDPHTPNHWEEGDETEAAVGGNRYCFTCIDSDYGGGALFLCNTVIPADFGSEYADEYLSPGPLSFFGTTNDYRTSGIKAFLDLYGAPFMKDTVIKINESASGSTKEGKYGNTTGSGIQSCSIGYRQMTGEMFILSLDEALTYTDWLWKFNGSDTDNPKTVTGPFASAYWLRTPYGSAGDYADSGMVYVVDLEKGNIHPASVMPTVKTGDNYTDMFTAVGIRPAFVLENE